MKIFDRKSKPKIGICAMPLEGGKSGIGIYIMKLCEAISKRDDIELFVFGFEDERELLNLDSKTKFISVNKRYSSLAANLGWHAALLPMLALRYRLDALFLPAGNRRMTLMPPLHPTKVVATVHDLAQFHLSNKYDKLRTFYVTKVLPSIWRKTDLILSVSKSTARDLQEITSVKTSKINVIWNGIDHSKYRPIDKEVTKDVLKKNIKLPKKFILYVARIEHPGKNHVGLLHGYKEFLNRKPDTDVKLVFCGGDWNGAEAVKEEVKLLQLAEKVVFTGFIKENLLKYTYNYAKLFAFPSLFEGFGIPAIEAMACGVPVVSSNRASLPEIVEGVGLLFDPLDTDSIATALMKGLYDEDFRRQTIEKGLEHAKSFSWDIAAKKTVQSILRLMEN